MALLLTILTPIIFCIGVWLVREYRWRSLMQRPDPDTRIYQDLETCEWIIEGFGMTQDVSNMVRKPRKSRAIPNQRLVRAFGIDNAFTTTDGEYYQHFKRRTELLLKISDKRWTRLAHTATELAALSLQASVDDHRRTEILLIPFVQRMVLKFSMHVLFSVPVDELDDDAIAVISEKVNSLWMSSKNPKPTKSMRSDQRELRAALRKIFPRAGKTARDNPLNLILPAYETMWRVVLRCFLEVACRPHNDKNTPVFRQILARFLADPSRATFETPTPEAGGLSPAFIIDEALRLYPPTRRIYRLQHFAGLRPVLVAADIEHLHRDPRVWGEESSYFDPARWIDASSECRRAFLPFGSKPFACPAKRDTGPRMIGVLVAALLAVFGEDWVAEARRTEDVIPCWEALAAGRDCYASLVLKGPFA